MSTINKDQEMLDKIASLYYKTSGDMRKMWEKKWYEGVKNVARRHIAKCIRKKERKID
jgi:hypothetical protein